LSGNDGVMRILIFHGYLLRGTGSNVYNASLARALAGLGHEVHLLCQDHGAETLGWVDAVGRWSKQRLAVERVPGGSEPGPGSITAYLPDIGGLLPVYVDDSYAGFRVKTFPELSDEELEAYIRANVHAVREVAERAGGVGAALANHLVMGPVILARSGLPFAAKVHGSALSYTVIPDPRFLPYAREGIDAAAAVLVGSRHTAESLWETLDDPSLPGRTRLGPPGVDIEAFATADKQAAPRILPALAGRLAGADPGARGSEDFGRDSVGAARALAAYAEGAPRVAFVGKLIVSKGCDLLLAAWPLIHRELPGASLLIAGFGAYRDTLERLWAALVAGEVGVVAEIARAGRGLEGGEQRPLRILEAFLDSLPAGYLASAQAAAGSVQFPGRLEHFEVAEALRESDAMVVPSTFPEAFGMVAAEGAAAAALPVCADHSGLAEVAEALDADLPAFARGLTAFPLDDRAVEAIAERVVRWLSLSAGERGEAGRALTATVERLWSWEGVARGVIAASAGDLDDLPRVPAGG
jgi:glycosyltransferase involved in cell wall biosynthesis